MYALLLAALFSIALVALFFRRAGLRYIFLSTPTLASVFAILYCIVGLNLFYRDGYYLLGVNQSVHLGKIYQAAAIFTLTMAIAFVIAMRMVARGIRLRALARPRRAWIYAYVVFNLFYVMVYAFVFNPAGYVFPLHNFFLLLFNSLIPILLYGLLDGAKYYRVLSLAFVALSIYIGFRYRLILLFLPLGIYVAFKNGHKPKQLFRLVGATLGAFFLIAIVGVTRRYSSGLDVSVIDDMSITEILVTGIFNDTSTVLASGATIHYIEEHGSYAYFDQLSYIAQYFIPASIYQGKAYSPIFDYIAATTWQTTNQAGLAILGYAEYFHTAGYVGVVFFALLFGFWSARLYVRIGAAEGLDQGLFVYSLFAGWFVNSLTRGYFPQNASDLVSILVGLWLLRISRRRVRINGGGANWVH